MKRTLLLFYITIFTITSAFGETLTLERARLLALANSRSLARYELAIRSSILDERNQLFSMLPSLSAGYTASMYYLQNWEFVNPVDTFTAGANFSITQVIFQGGRNFIQRAISAISTESVRKDALAEYFNVLNTIDNAFYAALEAAATLESEETSLEAAVLKLSIAEIRHESGMISHGEFLRAMAEKEARENSRNVARRNLTLAKTRLKILTGLLEISALEQIDFSIYDDVLMRFAGISDEDANMLFSELWKLMELSNPSLAKSALNNQRAEQNLSLTRRDHAPTVTASIFATGFNYSTANGFNTTGSGGLSLRGSIPVDFWVMNNRIERSRISRDMAALDFVNLQISLEMDLQTALLNAFAQAGSVLSSRRSLEYTERHFEYISERYRLLQRSVSDMVDASNLFINSRNNHIRASYGFLQSLSRLRSLGAISDEAELLRILLGN